MASKDSRDAVVEQIIQRQDEIEVNNMAYTPLLVFSEGTTTNGKVLLPFKRGAFQGMRTITPTCFKTSSGSVEPSRGVTDLFSLFVMMFSSLACSVATLTIYPDVTPTPKMLELHADKGESPWQIYAWVVRDIISKHSDMPKVEDICDIREKRTYEALMRGKADRVEIKGQIWEYVND